MAAPTSTTISILLVLLSISCAANFKPAASSDQDDAYVLSSGPVSRSSVEKQTHFRFYFQDIVSGPNPTAIRVAEGPGTMNSSSFFGAVYVIDDALTAEPDVKSKLVGRAQGFYAFADSKQVGLLLAMNFVLTDGKYNGSTIAIMGHNQVLSAVREMSIVGGTGLFRFARGYVQARTYSADLKSKDATVEYNVFVNHY